MQRLYSTFPNAWPGLGLLLLRFAQGASIVVGSDFDAWKFSARTLLHIVELLMSVLLAIGLWTPIAGVIQAMIECSAIYVGGHFSQEHFAGALVGLALAMLGPGSWSIDAHLFGRHRVQIKDFDD